MKKIIIMVPVFNDWESLKKLLLELNENIRNFNYNFKCLIINDSSNISRPKISIPDNLSSISVLNMKENRGHARCNAFGIRYVLKEEVFDYLIIMDSDGEDRPIEIKSLIGSILKDPNNSVVAKRIKRSEGPIFQFLYRVHKLITYIFTGKKINFGNYSCLTRKDVEKLSNKASLWSSYSGSVKKHLTNFNEVDSIRGTRYFGPSQMSLFKLIIHSFSIIAVFKNQVFLRSLFFLIFLESLSKVTGQTTLLAQSFLIFFNIIILITSFRENERNLLNSENNLGNKEELKH